MTDSYRVLVKPSAALDFRSIPRKQARRIDQRILQLSADPRPPGCEKLAGIDQYRVRQGKYRILYTIDDAARTVVVFKVQHRREVYR